MSKLYIMNHELEQAARALVARPVSVEQRHIDRGARMAAITCPIALAVGERIQGRIDGVRVSVSHDLGVTFTVNTGTGWTRYSWHLTPKVGQWIRAFDAAKASQPVRLRFVAPSHDQTIARVEIAAD